MSGSVRDVAWARRMVKEAGGRPHRMMVVCLLAGREADAWRRMSRAQQEVALKPFVLEGERLHWSREGEGFIVSEEKGGMGQSEFSSFSLDELKAMAAAKAHWSKVKQGLSRQAYQEAYAQATLDMAPRYVELERKVLDRGLAPDASAQERRLAMAAWKDWKDRHMGRPVAPVEDVTTKGSEVADWIAAEAPSVLPLSAGWTVESVAEEQQALLEAGELGAG